MLDISLLKIHLWILFRIFPKICLAAFCLPSSVRLTTCHSTSTSLYIQSRTTMILKYIIFWWKFRLSLFGVNVTHLVGGHFIGNGSLARLAGISLTRKVFSILWWNWNVFLSSKVSVFNLSLRIIKKIPLEATLLLLSPIVSNLVTCEFLLVVDYHRGSRIEMVYYPPYPWGVCPQMSQIPCVDSHNSSWLFSASFRHFSGIF